VFGCISTWFVVAAMAFFFLMISSVVRVAVAVAMISPLRVQSVIWSPLFMFVSMPAIPGVASGAPWHMASTAVSRRVIFGRCARAFSMGCMAVLSSVSSLSSFQVV
jgi:hypothetical protein